MKKMIILFFLVSTSLFAEENACRLEKGRTIQFNKVINSGDNFLQADRPYQALYLTWEGSRLANGSTMQVVVVDAENKFRRVSVWSNVSDAEILKLRFFPGCDEDVEFKSVPASGEVYAPENQETITVEAPGNGDV